MCTLTPQKKKSALLLTVYHWKQKYYSSRPSNYPHRVAYWYTCPGVLSSVLTCLVAVIPSSTVEALAHFMKPWGGAVGPLWTGHGFSYPLYTVTASGAFVSIHSWKCSKPHKITWISLENIILKKIIMININIHEIRNSFWFKYSHDKVVLKISLFLFFIETSYENNDTVKRDKNWPSLGEVMLAPSRQKYPEEQGRMGVIIPSTSQAIPPTHGEHWSTMLNPAITPRCHGNCQVMWCHNTWMNQALSLQLS